MLKKISYGILIIFFTFLSTWTQEINCQVALDQGKTVLKVKRKESGKWKCVLGKQNLACKTSDDITFKLLKNEKLHALGKIEGNQLLVKKPGGGLLFSLILFEDKTTVKNPENNAIWKLKIKPDKVKVYKNEVEWGKVKIYENAQVKAKDLDNQIIAKVKNLDYLSSAPAAFFLTGTSREQQCFIMLLLFSLGR